VAKRGPRGRSSRPAAVAHLIEQELAVLPKTSTSAVRTCANPWPATNGPRPGDLVHTLRSAYSRLGLKRWWRIGARSGSMRAGGNDLGGAVGGHHDGPFAVVDQMVVEAAEQAPLVDVGGSAIVPGDDVVGFGPGGRSFTAEKDAALVSDGEGERSQVRPARLLPAAVAAARRSLRIEQSRVLATRAGADPCSNRVDRHMRGDVGGGRRNRPRSAARGDTTPWTAGPDGCRRCGRSRPPARHRRAAARTRRPTSRHG